MMVMIILMSRMVDKMIIRMMIKKVMEIMIIRKMRNASQLIVRGWSQ